MSERTPPIRSELLAAKIEKLQNFELLDLVDQFAAEPRFIRALWFLEFVSKPDNYAGGLTKFANDLIDDCAGKIGTPTMVRLGVVTTYKVDEAIAIFHELPYRHRAEIFGDDLWIFENALRPGASKSGRIAVERIIERRPWRDLADDEWRTDSIEEDELQTWTGTPPELHSLLLARLTPTAVREIYLGEARESLAEYFKQLCELPHVGFLPNKNGHGAPFYFSGIGETLLDYIERRAAGLRSTIAETKVTQIVFRWMEKARTMKRPIMISGNSRFGKTEAVKMLCKMEPGNFRIVNTPASNAIGDLFREVAKSLGIEVGAQNSVRDLRERIDYVLRISNLVLCFDEFQFALPATFSRNAAPPRLNWIRRSIIDQEIGAVFICTPQSYLPAKKRFVRATGFAMEQFDERILKTVHLPDELAEEDLLAVARIHFAGLAEDYLSLVVGAALATERNYVSDIEKIATLAKDNAREEGRELPLLCDIEAAIADVLPAAPARTAGPTETKTKRPVATPILAPCNRPAVPLQPVRILAVEEMIGNHDRQAESVSASPSNDPGMPQLGASHRSSQGAARESRGADNGAAGKPLPQSRRGMEPLAVKT